MCIPLLVSGRGWRCTGFSMSMHSASGFAARVCSATYVLCPGLPGPESITPMLSMLVVAPTVYSVSIVFRRVPASGVAC